jgi:hypothetical protein
MGILLSRFKYYRHKNRYSNEEVASIVDYSNEINKIDEKTDEVVDYLQDELIPVVNELKNRIYHLEVNNNELKRKLNKYENNNSELFLSSESKLNNDASLI